MPKSFSIQTLFKSAYNQVKTINDSKLFAGLIVIIMNVASKFTTVPISKTMESYLRNTFSKHILVFAICWMGTRDIFAAITIFIMFTILMQVFFNEESPFCCFTEEFTDYHMSLRDENDVITKDEMDAAIKTLEKAKTIIREAQGESDERTADANTNNNMFMTP